jgi:hypothetical protein
VAGRHGENSDATITIKIVIPISIGVRSRICLSLRNFPQCGHVDLNPCGTYHLAFGGHNANTAESNRQLQLGQRYFPMFGSTFFGKNSGSQTKQIESELTNEAPQLEQRNA